MPVVPAALFDIRKLQFDNRAKVGCWSSPLYPSRVVLALQRELVLRFSPGSSSGVALAVNIFAPLFEPRFLKGRLFEAREQGAFAERPCMKLNAPEHHDRTSWLRACIGATVLFGILVTGPQDAERHRIGTDILLALSTLVLISGGSRMAVSIEPRRVMIFGAILVAMGLTGPFFATLLSQSIGISVFILPVIVLEFAGAALFAAGARRLISLRQR